MYNNKIDTELIMKRVNFLKEFISGKEQKTHTSSHGSIHAIKHGKGFQYYLRESPKEKNGMYLPKARRDFARKLIEQEYDTKTLAAAKHELYALESILRVYEHGIVEQIYENMPLGKQSMINPEILPDDIFLQNWLNTPYDKKGFLDDSQEYYTNSGIRVRSKSEVLISYTLDKLQIKYLYEKPLYLKGYGIIHPDFTLMNLKRRKEIYYEHLGMLDDPDYCNKALQKIQTYESNGIFLGDRLIISGETSTNTLNTRKIEHLLNHYFY